MLKILLVCAGGFSTTMIVEEIKETIKEDDSLNMKDFKLEAISVDRLESYLDEYNVVLVGPQLGHKFEYIREITEKKKILAVLLTPELYGEMDGKKILDEAINKSDEYYR